MTCMALAHRSREKVGDDQVQAGSTAFFLFLSLPPCWDLLGAAVVQDKEDEEKEQHYPITTP